MKQDEMLGVNDKAFHYPKYETATLGFRNYWYPLMFSKKLRKKPAALTVLGENIVLIRDQRKVYGLQNRCPHRGIRLSAGSCLSPGTITCPYHGWTFELNTGTLIAALSDSPNSGICGKANVRTYPVEERAGIIWIFIGDKDPPPVEVDIPSDLLNSDIVILGRVQIERGNWRIAAENAMDEAHARFLHRKGIWTLFRESPAWTRFHDSLTNDPEPWIVRTYDEIKWQDNYPVVGLWPPKYFWQRRRRAAGKIAGKLPCVLRNGAEGKLRLFNWWVPVDETHHLRFMTMTKRANGLKALAFKLWFWLYARWARLILFTGQDLWMIELTEIPPERLFAPDVSITFWRKYCEDYAR